MRSWVVALLLVASAASCTPRGTSLGYRVTAYTSLAVGIAGIPVMATAPNECRTLPVSGVEQCSRDSGQVAIGALMLAVGGGLFALMHVR